MWYLLAPDNPCILRKNETLSSWKISQQQMYANNAEQH